MQRIIHLIKKEFRQIFREKSNLGIIFLMPFIQLLILGFAITNDVKNLGLVIVDKDHTLASRYISSAFATTSYFKLESLEFHEPAAIKLLDKGLANIAVVIPQDLQKDLQNKGSSQLQLIIDGVDGNSAGIALGYTSSIISKIQPELSLQGFMKKTATGKPLQIVLEPRYFYNNNLESTSNIVPGIIAMLVTMITLFLTSINIVKEKETGTLEQLMVTPLKPHEIIIGKIMPFAILGFILLNVGILAAGLVFGIWIKGNMFTLYFLSIIFMFTTLGLGILFSTLASTQQQAMLMAWFFSIFSILLSGFFVPIENMPDIIQFATLFNPLRYYLQVIRGIFLKGSSFSILLPEFFALLAFGVAIITLASVRFQKRLK